MLLASIFYSLLIHLLSELYPLSSPSSGYEWHDEDCAETCGRNNDSDNQDEPALNWTVSNWGLSIA